MLTSKQRARRPCCGNPPAAPLATVSPRLRNHLAMFRNLSTSTKLFILCSMFIVAIVVAIYSLVAEKEIAIEFARKELVGVRYFETLRGVYAAILAEPS